MKCSLKEDRDHLLGQTDSNVLSKKNDNSSLPEIGRRFANRDHTTVIHAVKTITRLSEQDDEMKKNISQIKSLLLEQ